MILILFMIFEYDTFWFAEQIGCHLARLFLASIVTCQGPFGLGHFCRATRFFKGGGQASKDIKALIWEQVVSEHRFGCFSNHESWSNIPCCVIIYWPRSTDPRWLIVPNVESTHVQRLAHSEPSHSIMVGNTGRKQGIQ